MRKRAALLFLAVLCLFATQIETSRALHETYTWDLASGVGGYHRFQISLITSDSWQVDTTVEITFRITLISKIWDLDHIETNWVKIVLTTENFVMDSGNQVVTDVLRDTGDYWEKRVSFYIPTEKVNRGQTLTVSVTFILNIDAIDTTLHWRWEHSTNNYNNPMQVSLSRPFLSTFELIVVALVAIIAVGGISGFLLYRRMRHPVKTPPTPAQ